MPASKDLLDDYFQWEVRSWSRALPMWHKALMALRHDKIPQALALGERDGGLSLMLAEHGCSVVCSDLRGPTERARELHAAHDRAGSVTYESIDTLSIPKPDNSFDAVVFKSMIGALSTKERQAQAIREMHRVLKPGGMLLFAENLHGTALHGWLRKRFVAWDAYWRYLDVNTDRDLFKPFLRLDDATTGFLANLGRSEGQRDLIARFDGLIMPIVPKSMRTIWFGVAIKG
ncbi:MAG TPA: methyltransferase domain-containing protein [Flavobacteriales bacterium]|nr:methyltransferase domain-containing protein [Flavobacteriales bacterium]